MNSNQTADTKNISLNAQDLYREETYTDRRVGTLRQLTPVKPDGSPDPKRELLYVGQSQLLTPMGALPLNFEIPAHNMEEALKNFGAAAQDAVKQTMEELKEMRRQAASSLVIPEPGAGGTGGLGGGKIVLR